MPLRESALFSREVIGEIQRAAREGVSCGSWDV